MIVGQLVERVQQHAPSLLPFLEQLLSRHGARLELLVALAPGLLPIGRQKIGEARAEVAGRPRGGDAFGGAICHGLLQGWSVVRCAEAGNAAGAIVASRLMCADDMPTVADIEGMLADGAV